MNKVFATLVCVILALTTLSAVIYRPIRNWLDPYSRRSFNKADWYNAARYPGGNDIRGTMLSDLLKNHLLPGTKKDKIINLLGHPDEVDTYNTNDIESKYLGDTVLRYYIGNWEYPIPRKEYLSLYFNKHDELRLTDRIVMGD